MQPAQRGVEGLNQRRVMRRVEPHRPQPAHGGVEDVKSGGTRPLDGDDGDGGDGDGDGGGDGDGDSDGYGVGVGVGEADEHVAEQEANADGEGEKGEEA